MLAIKAPGCFGLHFVTSPQQMHYTLYSIYWPLLGKICQSLNMSYGSPLFFYASAFQTIMYIPIAWACIFWFMGKPESGKASDATFLTQVVPTLRSQTTFCTTRIYSISQHIYPVPFALLTFPNFKIVTCVLANQLWTPPLPNIFPSPSSPGFSNWLHIRITWGIQKIQLHKHMPGQLSEGLWGWGPGISIFFLILRWLQPAAKVENYCFWVEGTFFFQYLWLCTCFCIWISCELFCINVLLPLPAYRLLEDRMFTIFWQAEYLTT